MSSEKVGGKKNLLKDVEHLKRTSTSSHTVDTWARGQFLQQTCQTSPGPATAIFNNLWGFNRHGAAVPAEERSILEDSTKWKIDANRCK